MAHTVVGIFDTASEAQNAVEELVENGFDRHNIDISYGSEQNSSSDWSENENTGFGETVSNFFKSLFNGKDEAYKYSEVAKNTSMVTVYTSSEDQAEDVADILDDCGAIDVDDRAIVTNTITTGGTTIGRTDTAGSENQLGTVTDSVTQYGDRANEDRIKTGTFQDPVGGDLDDRIGSFADTTRTINNSEDSDNNTIDQPAQSDTTIQRRSRSRIIERPVGDELRLWKNKDRETDV
ncbi:hypothetical protein [Xanthocytophaga flava]|uniref:hypothetical protein n=1 Tax=Xanthocytophaga flava TaxID=3048013 RepID=UPI0028D1AF21|nr:hypothetical protein [Xanthocytophaga flavus]MDJ1467786.1 hypothetical protein [Xanthocytophaga flavus]